MEKLKNIKKVIIPLIILIIMIGVILMATMGFNFGLIYQSHKRIEIYINKEYSKEELTDLVKEVFPDEEIIMQNLENFDKNVCFTVKEMSDEQLQDLKDKVNSKYELDTSKENVVVLDEPDAKLIDIVRPYIKPLIIVTIIICVYLLIRFRKLGMINAGLLPIASLIAMQALYYSVWAICRIPLSRLTMPLSVLVYIITACIITVVLEKMNRNTFEE